MLTPYSKASKSNQIATIDDITLFLSNRLFTEIDHLRNYDDILESELVKELENGRVARLLSKLEFINERFEYDMDPSWSEAGDNYILKLFRDYLFHQVAEDGNPIIDLAHVIESINKLDIGSQEKIVLMRRDEQSMLVVSYKDLKRCVESAFNELMDPSKI